MDRAYLQALVDAPDRDQVVVLHGVPWAQYEALLEARGDRRSPKMAFLDGELELVTKSLRHELGKTLLARLVECWAEERNVELIGAGETTFRRKLKKAGLEPDECYWVDRITAYPELAVEVIQTSGGIDKLEIYRRLGVVEVWFWIAGKIWLYRLVGERYQKRRASALLRGIDLTDLERISTTADDDQQTTTIRAYRRSLRRKR